MLIKEQFGIIQKLQTSPIPQTSFLVGTFFAASYSKRVLEMLFNNHGIIRKLSMIRPAPIFILNSLNYYSTDFNHLLGPRNGRKNY